MRRAVVILLVALASLAMPASASASDEQIVLTGDLNVPRGEVVSDAISISGDANVAGTVTEDLIVVSGDARISGTVEGDVVVLSEPAVLTRTARVGGDLIYGEDRPVVAAGATVAGDTREFDGSDLGDEIGTSLLVFSLLVLIGFPLSTLAIGLVALWLFPRAADALLDPAGERVGASIGWGLLLTIGLPILAILLLVTVIGIPLGGFLLLALLPLYAIGHVTSQWLLGRKIVGAPRARWTSFLAGWAILNVAAVVPFAGALVGTAATVYGLGVLAVTAWQSRQSQSTSGPRAPTPVPGPAAAGPPVPPPPA